MLKLELQCLVTWLEELTHWKRAWCWKRLKARGEGVTEDETVGKHHWVNGHELAQTPCPCPQRVGHDMTTEQQSCLSSLSGYEGHWPVLTLWTAQQPWTLYIYVLLLSSLPLPCSVYTRAVTYKYAYRYFICQHMPISLCIKQGFVFLVLTLPHLVGVWLIFKICYEAMLWLCYGSFTDINY